MPKDNKDDIRSIQIWISTKLSEKWKSRCKDNLGKIHVEENPHISLTKVGVTLQQHWINDFTNTLKNKFQHIACLDNITIDMVYLLNVINIILVGGRSKSLSMVKITL